MPPKRTLAGKRIASAVKPRSTKNGPKKSILSNITLGSVIEEIATIFARKVGSVIANQLRKANSNASSGIRPTAGPTQTQTSTKPPPTQAAPPRAGPSTSAPPQPVPAAAKTSRNAKSAKDKISEPEMARREAQARADKAAYIAKMSNKDKRAARKAKVSPSRKRRQEKRAAMHTLVPTAPTSATTSRPATPTPMVTPPSSPRRTRSHARSTPPASPPISPNPPVPQTGWSHLASINFPRVLTATATTLTEYSWSSFLRVWDTYGPVGKITVFYVRNDFNATPQEVHTGGNWITQMREGKWGTPGYVYTVDRDRDVTSYSKVPTRASAFGSV